MSEAARELPYTLEDWIELEKTAEIRSELEDGVLKQFSSKTKTHNELVMNFSSALRPIAKKQGCQEFVFSLKTIADGQGYYPDVMLTCYPRGNNRYVEYNPCLVAEILSMDTSFRDQIIKRDRYLRIPTLEQYVLVFCQRVQVHVYQRCEGYWKFLQFSALEDRLEITCLQDSITLEQIYEDVILEPETQEDSQD